MPSRPWTGGVGLDRNTTNCFLAHVAPDASLRPHRGPSGGRPWTAPRDRPTTPLPSHHVLHTRRKLPHPARTVDRRRRWQAGRTTGGRRRGRAKITRRNSAATAVDSATATPGPPYTQEPKGSFAVRCRGVRGCFRHPRATTTAPDVDGPAASAMRSRDTGDGYVVLKLGDLQRHTT